MVFVCILLLDLTFKAITFPFQNSREKCKMCTENNEKQVNVIGF